MNIPDVWPTEEMLNAAASIQLIGFVNWEYLREVVTAALAAAPTITDQYGSCGNGECNWRGELKECSYLGAIGPCCPKCREIVEPDQTSPAQEADLHPATADLVNRFSRALAEKLASAEKKYGYSDGWLSSDWMDECRYNLIEHVKKGDPRDVAAYCAFLWHHGEKTGEIASSGHLFTQLKVAPAQEAEPVAELTGHTTGGYAYIRILAKADKLLALGTKLYTHPANDELRKAAEEVRAYFRHADPIDPDEVERLMVNLAAALEGKS